MEETELGQQLSSKMKLEIKQNAKREKSYSYTVRADTIEELTTLKELVKRLAEIEVGSDIQ